MSNGKKVYLSRDLVADPESKTLDIHYWTWTTRDGRFRVSRHLTDHKRWWLRPVNASDLRQTVEDDSFVFRHTSMASARVMLEAWYADPAHTPGSTRRPRTRATD